MSALCTLRLIVVCYDGSGGSSTVPSSQTSIFGVNDALKTAVCPSADGRTRTAAAAALCRYVPARLVRHENLWTPDDSKANVSGIRRRTNTSFRDYSLAGPDQSGKTGGWTVRDGGGGGVILWNGTFLLDMSR